MISKSTSKAPPKSTAGNALRPQPEMPDVTTGLREALDALNAQWEAQLAHTIESKVEAAYRRGDLFQKRVQLMRAWATYCETPVGNSKVIPIGRGQHHV